MKDVDIASPANPRVKQWRSLRSRSERDSSGTFLIEGRREVARAMDHLDVVERIVRSDVAEATGTATVVSPAVFDRISRRQNPDGFAAIVRTPALALEALEPTPDLVLVGDGIEKPGNIGAMVRTADAFGAAFVGASLNTDVVNPNVVRSAQGSLFACPTAAADRTDVIPWCASRTTILIASPSAGASVWDVDFSAPTSIVIGSEHGGVDAAWLSAGQPVTIPTTGVADSLNASVAAAVFLAEARRQRSA